MYYMHMFNSLIEALENFILFRFFLNEPLNTGNYRNN